MKTTIKYGLLFLALIFSLQVSAQSERRDIRKGNKEYYKALGDSGAVDTIDMQQAEVKYRKALNKNIESFEAGFNLGNALFKQQKFEEAEEQFSLLQNKTDEQDQLAQVYYNMGNSQLGGGKLEESIESYKQSLRINPADTAAKYNLAVAQKMLKEAEQQEQQQQQNKEQNQEQQQQDQQQEQKGEDQQEQQEQQAQQNEEKDEEQQEQKQAVQKDEISKEDAERLLKALQQQEKQVLQKLQNEKSKKRPKKLEKDW